jgi:hypothetical protein
MERKCDDLDPCLDPPGICRDSSSLWSAFGLCLWHDQSMYFPCSWVQTYANDFQTNPKQAKKAKTALDSTYSYLGGNAFGRDRKGRVEKDDSALSSEMAAAGVGGHGEGNEYTAYVFYEFEIL